MLWWHVLSDPVVLSSVRLTSICLLFCCLIILDLYVCRFAFCLIDSLPPSSFILHAIPSHCLPKAKRFKEDDERYLLSVCEEFQHLWVWTSFRKASNNWSMDLGLTLFESRYFPWVPAPGQTFVPSAQDMQIWLSTSFLVSLATCLHYTEHQYRTQKVARAWQCIASLSHPVGCLRGMVFGPVIRQFQKPGPQKARLLSVATEMCVPWTHAFTEMQGLDEIAPCVSSPPVCLSNSVLCSSKKNALDHPDGPTSMPWVVMSFLSSLSLSWPRSISLHLVASE